MQIEKLDRTNLTERVLNTLVDLIAEGHLKPGDKLPAEKELMSSLGVGRSSVRSALQTLTFIGLAEGRRGEGTFVRNNVSEFLAAHPSWVSLIGVQDILQILEARHVVEVELAGLAAERATSAQRRELEAAMSRMKADVHNLTAVRDDDLRIHMLLAAASQNQVLVRFMRSARALMRPWVDRSFEFPSRAECAILEHDAIVRAVVAGDIEAAREAMKTHLERSRELFACLLSTPDTDQPDQTGNTFVVFPTRA